jgi:hypothetical protein
MTLNAQEKKAPSRGESERARTNIKIVKKLRGKVSKPACVVVPNGDVP